ncbi:MAG: glycosyltransferase [Candidatus Omnitrophica bacterium]|nr:glycosyltransferase [Candidatus Omnitrophota bacterium]
MLNKHIKIKKVLHILWSGGSGGAEKFIYDTALHLDKDKFEPIICFLSGRGWLGEEISKHGIKVYFLGMKNGFSIIKGLRLFNIIRKVRPFIIHSHVRNYFCNFLIILFPGIYKIYFEHGGDLIGNKPKKEIFFYKYFSRFYNLILTNSHYARESMTGYVGIDPEKIRVFSIGIDLEQYNNESILKGSMRDQFKIPRNNRVIGMVGRLSEAKGGDDFIKVAHEINKIDLKENYTYVIIGDGDLREHLENMARELNVSILFLGDRKNISSLLRLFDIFLFTSKWESFGIALLESMASKIPVVGFSLPGPKEIIDRGGGILIEERSHKKLAEVVVSVLNNRNMYDKLAEDGRLNVRENFNIKKTIKKLEEEYDKFI